MTTRASRLLHWILPALAGAAVMGALLASASADTGDSPPAAAPWYRDPAIVTSGVVLAAYGLLAAIQRLGRERWRWTAWLRVGRVQAHLSGAVAALYVLVPAAVDGELSPRAAASGLLTWICLRNNPGGGEARPVRVEAGEVDDGQVQP